MSNITDCKKLGKIIKLIKFCEREVSMGFLGSVSDVNFTAYNLGLQARKVGACVAKRLGSEEIKYDKW